MNIRQCNYRNFPATAITIFIPLFGKIRRLIGRFNSFAFLAKVLVMGSALLVVDYLIMVTIIQTQS